jgi:hypothetical protein
VTAKILLKSFLCDRKEKNGMRSGKPLTGRKKAAFSKDFQIDKIKRVSKEFGVTINDVLMTVTSISLKQYLIK